jgi:hypothetical protein
MDVVATVIFPIDGDGIPVARDGDCQTLARDACRSCSHQLAPLLSPDAARAREDPGRARSGGRHHGQTCREKPAAPIIAHWEIVPLWPKPPLPNDPCELYTHANRETRAGSSVF